MTVLAIDTSTSRGTVALLRDGAFLLDEVFTADRSQSSALFPILEKARTLAPKLDIIAINTDGIALVDADGLDRRSRGIITY